eukprot:gnl/MRDRNA2_/MRDRNA2_153333_c0_seq1.p1 gnl/MRDRNA2_/MRDRNA2_153333_c0~~gnl/MRDRNA2_/MRDRNA2_153333_c0_seq1.p1  ORF type:complete len:629 (+),score=99.95 gnl/MRDRNA2_/MRDRNA2_153333_c0_seq1:103-1989(+)
MTGSFITYYAIKLCPNGPCASYEQVQKLKRELEDEIYQTTYHAMDDLHEEVEMLRREAELQDHRINLQVEGERRLFYDKSLTSNQKRAVFSDKFHVRSEDDIENMALAPQRESDRSHDRRRSSGQRGSSSSHRSGRSGARESRPRDNGGRESRSRNKPGEPKRVMWTRAQFAELEDESRSSTVTSRPPTPRGTASSSGTKISMPVSILTRSASSIRAESSSETEGPPIAEAATTIVAEVRVESDGSVMAGESSTQTEGPQSAESTTIIGAESLMESDDAAIVGSFPLDEAELDLTPHRIAGSSSRDGIAAESTLHPWVARAIHRAIQQEFSAEDEYLILQQYTPTQDRFTCLKGVLTALGYHTASICLQCPGNLFRRTTDHEAPEDEPHMEPSAPPSTDYEPHVEPPTDIGMPEPVPEPTTPELSPPVAGQDVHTELEHTPDGGGLEQIQDDILQVETANHNMVNESASASTDQWIGRVPRLSSAMDAIRKMRSKVTQATEQEVLQGSEVPIAQPLTSNDPDQDVAQEVSTSRQIPILQGAASTHPQIEANAMQANVSGSASGAFRITSLHGSASAASDANNGSASASNEARNDDEVRNSIRRSLTSSQQPRIKITFRQYLKEFTEGW